jgi:Putative MetA-pathway of phenol degradation
MYAHLCHTGPAQCGHPIGAMAIAVALMVSMAWAADDGLLKVEPDRPNISNSTQTVPPRALQVELGLKYTRSHNDSTERRLAAQTTLRTGLSDRLELRLDSEPLVRLKEDSDDVGLGDIAVGVKARLFEPSAAQGWPTLGVQPFVKIPTARTPIGSGRLDAGILALADQDLPWEIQLTVNAGLVVVGHSHGALLQGLASASLSREFWGRLSPFLELFFASRGERDGHDAVVLNAGVIYLVTGRVALDAAAEVTLNRHRPDYALRTGVSLLVGR